jgi:hypothetical protein
MYKLAQAPIREVRCVAGRGKSSTLPVALAEIAGVVMGSPDT